MKATRQLHDLGQSLWLDNITRGILNDGTLQRYISELSVTGPATRRPGVPKVVGEVGGVSEILGVVSRSS